jgi:putative transposase
VDDALVTVRPALDRYDDFAAFLGTPADYTEAWQALRKSETSGRPIGARDRIEEIEKRTGRTLAPQKRGPKPKVASI